MKAIGKIFKTVASAAIIMIYIAMIAMLIWQALTPGEESADISQSFGDKLNDAVGEIGTPESSKVAVSGVEIAYVIVDGEEHRGESLTISLGDYGKIKANVKPEDATNRALEYFTSDDSIVKVYPDGRIFAVSSGIVTITVKSAENPNYSHSITVTVQEISLEKIEFGENDTELSVGETSRLELELYPENTSENAIIWSSSNPEVLKVDKNGTITAISEGEAEISATSEGNSEIFASVKITVLPKVEAPEIPLESIKLSANESVGFVGEKMTISANLYPDGASGKLTWYSSDESVATVTQKGVVSFLKSGVVTITVKCGTDISDSAIISVKEVLSENIYLDFDGIDQSEDDSYIIKQGESGKINATLDKNATIKDISFSSSNEKVVKIGQDGSIEALRGGSVTITVSTSYDGEVTSKSFVLTVDPLTLEDTIDNFYYFVRKSMGHFGAFLVLGIFAALSYYIILPKHIYGKITAFEITMFAGFAVAGITEILQLPYFTQGRHGSFDDVLLDFIGYCTSTIPMYVIIILFHYIGVLVKHIKNRKKAN